MNGLFALGVAIALFAPGIQPDGDDAPLRGPEVPARIADSIVNRTMAGRFVPVEGRPELAAVQAMSLPPTVLETAVRLSTERTDELAMFLVDELDEVRAITDLIMSGEQAAARERSRELWVRFEPERPRDPLAGEIEKLLDDEQRAEFRRLVDEYWDAWVAWETRDAEDPPPARLERVGERLKFQLYQEELRQAYDQSLRRYREVLDGIYEAVEATPEERERIRTVVLDHIKETRLRATPQQRRDAMLRIYRLLDEPKQELLFAYVVRMTVPDA